MCSQQRSIATMRLPLVLNPDLLTLVCADLVSALIDQCLVTMTETRAFFTVTDAALQVTPAESHALSMQRALRHMLLQQTHSHWVTLNFHGSYKNDVTEKKLRLWSLNVLSRLFAHSQFADMPTADMFRFTAMPEFTIRGDPHFHLLLWVDPRSAAYFERVAAKLWKHIIPTGSADVQPLKQTQGDYLTVINYATKLSHLPRFNSAFVHSSMLDLPPVCRTARPARQQPMRTSANAA